jgi:hypothetical protein
MVDKQAAADEPPWLGVTGLNPLDELGLIDHVREDEYATLGAPFSVAACDLSYVGKVSEGSALIHYWQLRDSLNRLSYASIGITDEYFVYDYGRWTPAHDRAIYG